jgi:hypothetical protein
MKLIAQRSTVLTIPNGSKKAILWVYKYLQTSEHNLVGMDTFEALESNALTSTSTAAFSNATH